ncbi:MAG: hypothetical protein ACJ8AT_22540 [Hyalangium sp.]|uniref:hypothetical protein n=1 Tax=Hyalangium sp. TaxID=2028555 RepID=UPI00389A4742
MHTHAPLLAMALACLAIACSENAALPPREAHAPPFEFKLYLDQGGQVIPGTDVLIVRRPEHLEHVYELSLKENKEKPGHAQAWTIFSNLEGQFRGAGSYVAQQVYSLRCTAVELPDCVPKWSFIEELLGPVEGPGSRRLRQALADSFKETARREGMKSTLVMAVVNVLLTEGMMTSTLGKAATAESSAAAAEHRAVVEAPAVQAQRWAAGEGRAAAVGAEQLAVQSGSLGLAVEVSAMEARLVEAEAQEIGARQTGGVEKLAGQRPSLENPLPGGEADEALWRDYVSYWDQRYAELNNPAGPAEGVKPPLTWPGYQAFRTRFKKAMEFQVKVSALLRGEVKLPQGERKVLRGMKQPRTDANVGLNHEGSTSVTYADDLAVDEATLKSSEPRVESVSTKQRDFMKMSEDDARRQVTTDAEEALAKYGGEVEVRRRGHPLFERRVTVSRVHLVYDEALVPKGSAFRERMLNAAKRKGVELHFHHAP